MPAILVGCRSSPAGSTVSETASTATPRPHTAPPHTAPPPDTAAGAATTLAEFDARPGYTFSETDLGRFVAALQHVESDPARRALRLARQNLGQPYDIYLLGEFPFERYDPNPLYCLSRSDCLTFCEHVFAAAVSRDWWSYLAALQRLRYRDGVIGMLTRNHFTEADWNPANAFLFEDLTMRLAAGRAHVPLTATIRRARFFARFGIGQDIPDQPLQDAYIPTERIPDVLGELQDADMVNIVRGDARQQWVGHTGLIAHAPDGTVNLLHSARPAVREQPLLEYVAGDARCVGIRILRLRPNAQRIMDDVLADSRVATPISPAALLQAFALSPFAPGGPLPPGPRPRSAP